MSRVDFAYGAVHRLRMACGTAARHVAAGRRLLVYCTDERRLQRFDALLWEFDPTSFIPHALADDPLADQADVILVPDAASLDRIPSLHWLLNLDLDCPPGAERFERILEIVSGHEADIQAARRRWTQYQQAGHDVRGHRLPADHPAAGNHRRT
ncbi:MAG: DNA polymerase III subunit chi [Castellaniella sp.]|uniref:DNA polymerase III subunit chi n=1 Tax=Castellaniella sp. TaxID=1955812 RepID=UPI002A35EBDF|nr:DNA polymerase III subunit chi [Castellaniella sp.]MDY0310265.1 DNA polymerase III subunit chi [Castellaniella sp.]